jgi:hypothetical protein
MRNNLTVEDPAELNLAEFGFVIFYKIGRPMV